MRRVAPALICAAIAIALWLPATSSAGKGLRFFHTADGNISCGIVKGQKKTRKRPRLGGGARCDVKSHTWVAPKRPRWCDLDWGDGVQVGEKGVAKYVCAGDTVADVRNTPVLAPGGAITLGRYTCTVPPDLPTTTVRCANNLNGHGFEVSAETVSRF